MRAFPLTSLGRTTRRVVKTHPAPSLRLCESIPIGLVTTKAHRYEEFQWLDLFPVYLIKGIVMINSISIRNFRSIERQDFKCNWITTFVGENDAGKSNILRALNLFFNDQTDADGAFDFSRDFNKFATVGRQKARQIEIQIRFELPSGYRRRGYRDNIEWRKVWRENGQVPELGYRRYVGGTKFPARSRIPALLDRIRFTYVPAIKDQRFFADLQGKLYDALASVAADPLRQSASDFEQQIQQQLAELLASIQDVFDDESALRLPENLRTIFESLEISTDGIPLSRRGDGIKIRHIPMILQFIADKHDNILNKGGIRYTHIWGFEEPENNVEMSAAFEMEKQLLNIVAESDRHQLFMTTHSPIFYAMEDPGDIDPNDVPWIHRYFVRKDNRRSEVVKKSLSEVDDSMGLMPLVTRHVKEAKQEQDRLNDELNAIREVAENRLPTLFLEGGTDVLVFGKALDVFAPGTRERMNLQAGGNAGLGGANALTSRSLAWLLEMRHRRLEDRTLGYAVFDADEAGRSARNELVQKAGQLNLQMGPHFCARPLRTPARLQTLAGDHYNITVDLESYFHDSIWEHSEKQGWLEELDDPRFGLSDQMVKEYFETGQDPREELDERDLRRLKNRFSADGKVRAASHVSEMADEEAKAALAEFEPRVSEIVAHLFPGDD